MTPQQNLPKWLPNFIEKSALQNRPPRHFIDTARSQNEFLTPKPTDLRPGTIPGANLGHFGRFWGGVIFYPILFYCEIGPSRSAAKAFYFRGTTLARGFRAQRDRFAPWEAHRCETKLFRAVLAKIVFLVYFFDFFAFGPTPLKSQLVHFTGACRPENTSADSWITKTPLLWSP